MRHLLVIALLALGVAVCALPITYQGMLMVDGKPATGQFDMQFALRNSISSTPTVDVPNVEVKDGRFTAQVEVGTGLRWGSPASITVAVRPAGTQDAYQPLASQALTPAPYALGLPGVRIEPQALGAYNYIGGSVWNTMADGVWGSSICGGGWQDLPNHVRQSFSFLGGGEDNIVDVDASGGAYGNAVLVGGMSNRVSAFWGFLGGGLGNKVTDRVGTVSGGNSNVAGSDDGDSGNATGATIGGGSNNKASAGNATIGGGFYNTASGSSATVAGGARNVASGTCSAVPGGLYNTAAGTYSFAAGHRSKATHAGAFVWGDSTDADVASDAANQFKLRASGGFVAYLGTGQAQIVPGGTSATVLFGSSYNAAGGVGSAVGGGGNDVSPNRALDSYCVVAGGLGNLAGSSNGTTELLYATVSGGETNQATGDHAVVGGGGYNEATASYATVVGGWDSTASGTGSTVAGGKWNAAAANYAFAAGYRAKANHAGSFVWADSTASDFTSDRDKQFKLRASGGFTAALGTGQAQVTPTGVTANVTLGASSNTVAGAGCTVGGGGSDVKPNRALDSYSTVSGGVGNLAGSDNAVDDDLRATVGGGEFNTASGRYGVVAGGSFNQATGDGSGVLSGRDNRATGLYAAVASGISSTAAGSYSFAAGRQAKANHTGSFVWGDATAADIASLRDNNVRLRANGGVNIELNNGRWVQIWDNGAGHLIDTHSGAHLTTGGAWTNASDRNLKANFAAVDGREVLRKVAAMPVSTWNYLAEGDGTRHMGPMAQDFHAAFALGSDDRSITTVDGLGVALAAIQGLQQELQARDARIAALEARLAALEAATVR